MVAGGVAAVDERFASARMALGASKTVRAISCSNAVALLDLEVREVEVLQRLAPPGPLHDGRDAAEEDVAGGLEGLDEHQAQAVVGDPVDLGHEGVGGVARRGVPPAEQPADVGGRELHGREVV